MCDGMIWLNLRWRGRNLPGSRYWELGMRFQKKYVWKFIKKKREKGDKRTILRKMNQDVGGNRKLFGKVVVR